MRFFLANFLVTLSVYGFTSFWYPAGATIVPRIVLIWAAPILGTLVASLVTRASWLRIALGAQALAIYMVCAIYCVIFHERAILDTLQYVTTIYFLPGAMLALLVGLLVKVVLRLGRS